MSEKTILTKTGYDKLVNELAEYKGTKMHEIADQIRIARGFGDLSENAEYTEAKNEQGRIQARIEELEAKLRNCEVISDDDNILREEVSIGSKVVVYDSMYDEEDTYEIVGSAESSPRENKISNESPIGKALIGHHKGDVFNVAIPAGETTLRVVDIL